MVMAEERRVAVAVSSGGTRKAMSDVALGKRKVRGISRSISSGAGVGMGEQVLGLARRGRSLDFQLRAYYWLGRGKFDVRTKAARARIRRLKKSDGIRRRIRC